MTPLQMARLYALIANGGKLVSRTSSQSVVEGGGELAPPARTHRSPTAPPQPVGLDPTYLAAVQDGLEQATHGLLRHLERRVRRTSRS